MSMSIIVSWSGRWMRMLSGEWLEPCHARSIRSPPISRVRRSWKVSSLGWRAASLSRRGRVAMRVDEVLDLVADAVRRGDLVDRALDVVADRRRGVEHDDAVRRCEK